MLRCTYAGLTLTCIDFPLNKCFICCTNSKTTLINQIKKPLEDINGRFIQVKFDFNTQPDTVLFSALDSFIEDIHDDEEGRELKQRIKEALGSEMS